MKRFVFIIAAGLLLSLNFSSCKKCYSCDFGNNDVREFCSKDFPDKTEGLQMTIDAYEKQGYKCTEK
jgi:hypothetical protein